MAASPDVQSHALTLTGILTPRSGLEHITVPWDSAVCGQNTDLALHHTLHVIDLTMTVSSRIPSFPGTPPAHIIPWNNIGTDRYNLEMLFMSSHTGTHIDAPYHFAAAGSGVDKIPLHRLAGKALLMRSIRGAGGLVTKSDILAFEKKHGRIGARSTVFFHTGWSKRPHASGYFTDNPGLAVAAARHLALRGISMVGIDSPSIDPGNNASFKAHKILADRGILIVENLVNLNRIPDTEFSFIVMPLKLKNASGSPVRAVAY